MSKEENKDNQTEKSINQIIIEKCNNGFIIATRQRESSNDFLNVKTQQVDKNYFVATSEEELIKIVEQESMGLITVAESIERLKLKSDDDEKEDKLLAF